MIARVVFFYYAQDSALIGVVPDDAFYYIQMARHRVIDGFWTFDGTSTTTGFHLLYAYLLAFIYYIFGETLAWRKLYLLIGVFSSIFIGLSAYFVSRTVDVLFGRKSILLAMAPYFSPIVLMQSTTMMETWLVMFFSAATIFFLKPDRDPSVSGAAGLIVLGILGSLARTDYGLLPGAIFLVYLISYYFLNSSFPRRSAFVLIGAVFGVAIVLIQNYYNSGQFLQASAQTKLYWSTVIGYDMFPALSLVGNVAIPLAIRDDPKLIALLSLCAVGLSIRSFYIFLRATERGEYPKGALVSGGCLLAVIGYVLFYGYNSQALQSWYLSNFVAPLGIILASIGVFLLRQNIFIPSIVAFFVYGYDGVRNISTIPWPHQAGMQKAGLFLKYSGSTATYASWNGGIISYFSGVHLVNIDGLTNDDVLPYIKNNTLFDYVRTHNINYIVDYDAMLSDMSYRIKGGYLARLCAFLYLAFVEHPENRGFCDDAQGLGEGRDGSAERAEGNPALLTQRPVENVELILFAGDLSQARDRNSCRDMDQREAAVAALRRHRPGVEAEGLHPADDLLVPHRADRSGSSLRPHIPRA